jgi:hypothetical protein
LLLSVNGFFGEAVVMSISNGLAILFDYFTMNLSYTARIS